MFCTKCGQQIVDGSAFCPLCGAPQAAPAPQPAYQQPVQPQYQQPQYQQPVQTVYQQPVQPQYQQPVQPPYQQPIYAPQGLDWKNFYNQCVSKKSKSYVTWMAVICFITAAISIPLMIVLENNLAIMDIAVYTILGALLLATKHWVFALLPTLYSAVWTVYGMVATEGAPSGIVALIVGASCVTVLMKANKAYNEYKTTGKFPEQQI